MSSSSGSLAIAFALLGMLIQAVPSAAAPLDETTKIRWDSRFGGRSFEVRGSVQFTDDDRDVKSISPGGYVRIEEGNWFQTDRFYEVRGDSNGSLARTFRVDGRAQTIDAEGQAWASRGILTLIRETGVNADLRVQRLLRTGGPAAVLREVSEIHSDGSKRIYLRELTERGRLDGGQLRDVMRSARTIGSDGDKTGLLVEVSPLYLKPGLRESWFITLSGVGSDGDKRHGLEHAISSDPDAETMAMSAKVAKGIGSDGDKAAVLSKIAAKGITQPVRRYWFRAAETIGSDGDKRHALSAVLAASGDDGDTLIEVLHTAETISADGDKAAVLTDAARLKMGTEALQHAFFSAAGTISSDGDRKAVLTSVLRVPNGSPALVAGVAHSAKSMSADGDKAAVLALAADFEMNDPAARASFFAAVNTISSDGDRAAVLSKVLKETKLGADTVVAAIDSAAAISSDGDKAAVLLLAAERHASHPAVRAALEKALSSVSSDGDYRRVSQALLRQKI